MKILLISDKSDLNTLKKHLASWNFDVIEKSSDAPLEDLLKTEKPDLAILGKISSGQNKLAICRELRRVLTPNKMFILVLLSKPNSNAIMELFKAGADDIITYPVKLPELRAKLRTGERILELQKELESRIKKLEESDKQIAKANMQIKRDIYAVAKIQASLLPASLPTVPNVEFAWIYKPKEELAGDGLNVFRLDEEHIAFYVLDVSGRGTGAALLSVSLSRQLSPFPSQSTLLKKLTDSPPGYEIISPSNVVRGLNDLFPMDVETQHFFTIFYGILNLNTLEMRYSLAGHPRPLLLRKNSVMPLEGGGYPIGFLDQADFDEYQIMLEPNDRLYVFSDGISEAKSPDNELFGRRLLAEAVLHTRDRNLKESVSFLLNEAEKWTAPIGLHDDVSILVLEIKEKRG